MCILTFVLAECSPPPTKEAKSQKCLEVVLKKDTFCGRFYLYDNADYVCPAAMEVQKSLGPGRAFAACGTVNAEPVPSKVFRTVEHIRCEACAERLRIKEEQNCKTEGVALKENASPR
ncbi:hypothetical protein MKZ38_008209 [Zalerion maritima]|uniref:Uncharacterized protein n=1 Tax=Zalerion maritima TaxID=339359 RepID=A0AAD5RGZ5_9PEZI|nr:hypothetical protein MKZ38_008209 [Zalerion maritima]